MTFRMYHLRELDAIVSNFALEIDLIADVYDGHPQYLCKGMKLARAAPDNIDFSSELSCILRSNMMSFNVRYRANLRKYDTKMMAPERSYFTSKKIEWLLRIGCHNSIAVNLL